MQLRNSQNKSLQSLQKVPTVISPLTNNASLGAFAPIDQTPSMYAPKLDHGGGLFHQGKASAVNPSNNAFKIEMPNGGTNYRNNQSGI